MSPAWFALQRSKIDTCNLKLPQDNVRISWYVHTCSTYKSAQWKRLKAVDRLTSRTVCTITSVYRFVIDVQDNIVLTTPDESIMTSGRVSDDIKIDIMKQYSLYDRATIGEIRTWNEETDYFNFLLVYGKVPIITLPLF